MERHKAYWQQFLKSGDPKMYLAYKQNHPVGENVKKRHENH